MNTVGRLPNEQCLIFGSKPLEDGSTLADNKIQEGLILYLVLRLLGGMQIFVSEM